MHIYITIFDDLYRQKQQQKAIQMDVLQIGSLSWKKSSTLLQKENLQLMVDLLVLT